MSYDPVNAVTGDESDDWTQYSTIQEQQDVDYRLYSGTLTYDFGPASLTSVDKLRHSRSAAATRRHDFNQSGHRRPVLQLFGAATGPTGLALDAGHQDEEVHPGSSAGVARLRHDSSGSSAAITPTRRAHCSRTSFRLTSLPNPRSTTGWTSQARDRCATTVALWHSTGSPPPNSRLSGSNSKYKEIAGFGSVTWHVTPRFDVTAGARYSHNKQTSAQFTNVLGGAPLSASLPTINGKSDESVFTWSIAPRYEVNDLLSVYARIAKGYRPGGPNAIPPGAPPEVPTYYDADTIISYEAGIRGETAGPHVRLRRGGLPQRLERHSALHADRYDCRTLRRQRQRQGSAQLRR